MIAVVADGLACKIGASKALRAETSEFSKAIFVKLIFRRILPTSDRI